MNKQQLIRVLKEQLDLKGNYNDYLLDSKQRINAVGNFEGMTLALSLIDQLEEPEQEKPVVPQFVADWMNKRKQNFKTSHDAILYIHSYGWDDETHIDFKLYKWIPDNVETFTKAWLDGYAIEKEKLYYVRENNYLLCKYNDEVIDYVEAVEGEITHLVKLKLTEQEIKDYDERFWAFAEEIKK